MIIILKTVGFFFLRKKQLDLETQIQMANGMIHLKTRTVFWIILKTCRFYNR